MISTKLNPDYFRTAPRLLKTLMFLLLIGFNSLTFGQVDESYKTIQLKNYNGNYFSRTIQPNKVYFTRDNKSFILSNYSDGICVYDSQNFNCLREIKVLPNEEIQAVSISPNGKFIFVSCLRKDMATINPKIIAITSGEVKYNESYSQHLFCSGGLFSSDEKYFAIILTDEKYKQHINIVNIESGTVIDIPAVLWLTGNNDDISNFYFTPDGNQLVRRSYEGFNFWDSKTGKLTKSLNINAAKDFVILNNTELVYSKGEYLYKLNFITNKNDSCLVSIPDRDRKSRDKLIINNTILFGNSQAILLTNQGTIIWDFSLNKLVTILQEKNKLSWYDDLCCEFKVSPDNKYAAVSSSDIVSIYDLKTGEIIKAFRNCDSFNFVVGWLNATQVLVSATNGIKLYDITKYVTIPTSFPELEICNVQIVDENGNNITEINKSGYIKFRIINKGKGSAINISFREVPDLNNETNCVSITNDPYEISIIKSSKELVNDCDQPPFAAEFFIGDLVSNSFADISIPYIYYNTNEMDVKEKISFEFTEQFGFSPTILYLELNCKKL